MIEHDKAPEHTMRSPFGNVDAPPADDTPKPDPKPERKSRDDMTPAEKAADTRAKNERREKREARAAEKADGDAELSPGQRTWTCPQCGRGITLGTADQPPTIMHCEGCGRDTPGDTWLPPGQGHGEPTLQTPRQIP